MHIAVHVPVQLYICDSTIIIIVCVCIAKNGERGKYCEGGGEGGGGEGGGEGGREGAKSSSVQYNAHIIFRLAH